MSCINYSLAKLEFDGNFPSLAFDFYTESCSALGPWNGDLPRPFPDLMNSAAGSKKTAFRHASEQLTHSPPSLPHPTINQNSIVVWLGQEFDPPQPG